MRSRLEYRYSLLSARAALLLDSCIIFILVLFLQSLFMVLFFRHLGGWIDLVLFASSIALMNGVFYFVRHRTYYVEGEARRLFADGAEGIQNRTEIEE